MEKLASKQYDILDYLMVGDLKKVAKVIKPLTKEARSATVPSFEELQDRPDKDFALILSGIKKFAKYDPVQTELSLAFLDEVMDELPDEFSKTAAINLSVAAKGFNVSIPEKVAALTEGESLDLFIDANVSPQGIDKVAYAKKMSDDSYIEKIAYALPEANKYPLRTSTEVTEAINYFTQNYNAMEGQKAVRYADNVKTAAESFGIETNSIIEKYASLDTESLNPDFNYFINSRLSYLSKEDEDTINNYNSLTKEAGTLDVKELYTKLTELDKEAALTRYWSNGIANPALTVFQQKVASNEVSLEDLKNIPDTELSDVVGEDAASQLKSDEGIDVYKTLPLPLKNSVNSLIIR